MTLVKPPHVAILYIYVDEQYENLYAEYAQQIENHNAHILNDPFPNSGFDIRIPEHTVFSGNTIQTKFVSFRIKAQMEIYDALSSNWKPTGFTIHPRSSLSKTPLMLANHTGIIDSGYRGELIGAFRNLEKNDYEIMFKLKLEKFNIRNDFSFWEIVITLCMEF